MIRIGGRPVGNDCPTFVIAEAGINHNGSRERALTLIDAAADAGCDAIKFQKRSVRHMLSREAFDKPYANNGHSYGTTYGEHRERLELDYDDYRAMRDHARARDILFMASAWDHESADFVESLGVAAHKIGSPDMTNLPLCAHVAKFGRPVILSTGMSEPLEVDAAVSQVGGINPELILLHCVSIYPTPCEETRLGNLATLRERYERPVGYSGHEHGWHLAVAAVAMGACMIEKHITLDKHQKGGDHHLSLEPDELCAMVQQIRETEQALTGNDKPLLVAELPARIKLAKSVTTRAPIPRGTVLTSEMLACKSPGSGIPSNRLHDVVGRLAARDIPGDTLIQREDLDR